MIEREIAALVAEGIERARGSGALQIDAVPDVEVERPREPSHGDWSTNAALRLQKIARRPPLEIAAAIVEHLPERDWVREVDVAAPGFINFRLSSTWLHEVVRRALDDGPRFGAPDLGRGSTVNVEFVSINPTGPLHIGSARNAVLGDAVARLLEFAGYKVTREYYFNDAGSQMTNFGLSVAVRYLQLLGRDVELPEDGYHGDYVRDFARMVLEREGDTLGSLPMDELGEAMRERAYPLVIDGIERSLDRLRIHIDVWSKERELYESGKVAAVLDRLEELRYVYEQDGAKWLRATAFGDTRDRVVVRSFGSKEPTYIVPDLAYHLDKAERGFEHMIVVLGADHHAHGTSLRAGMQALGVDPDRIEVLIYQWVHLLRGGEPVPMGRRTGSYVTIDELLDAVGPDATRYHLLHTSSENTIYFDIEEVKKQSDENPAHYVRYGHARVASLFREASSRGIERSDANLALLTEPAEIELMKAIAEFEDAVEFAVVRRAPYRVARHAEEVARRFHGFYEKCPVLRAEPEVRQARLALASATRHVLATALGLLGVDAPDRMERED